ncbi:hypothetical protein EYF80_013562 [Liparis tanakae]|uniref:Uncharacterized protein n=1 Tax=Liparis tanakae TaxID=230148 RepID=A0A4Z2IFS9_9TELE|nr:hypothetical protein EYF80_013562 [Liparis tanakae]
MVMTRTGPTKAKMNTQIFITVSQYHSAMIITGTPTAEERIQMQTLMSLALAGVRKSRALTG